MERVRDFLIAEQPTKDFPSISPEASLEEALARMRDEKVARLRVMENGTCLGVVHRIDLAVHRERSRLAEERQRLGAIAERDDMHKRSDDPAMQRHYDDWYYGVGLRAIDHIKATMRAVGKTEPQRILDLPCGHGRVLRFLKEAFSAAALTACDIDRDGVDFCAAEFGATPVYSVENPADIEIEGEFDLIYCGSLHVDRDRWIGFLDLFERLLAPGGILVVTTHGRFMAQSMEAEPPVPDTPSFLSEYRRTGFAYRNYVDQEGYGVSLSSPAWVCALLERWPTLELAMLQERGISQDVYGCFKRPACA